MRRFSILRVGQLHIRLHNILTADGTPHLHSHPFHYVSAILRGGYREQNLIDGKLVETDRKAGNIFFKKGDSFHRIKSLHSPTWTLFVAWRRNGGWDLTNHQDVENPPEYESMKDGIYTRLVKGKRVYSKFESHWKIGHATADLAKAETRHSIHQATRNVRI